MNTVHLIEPRDVKAIVEEYLLSRLDYIARQVDHRINKGTHISYNNGTVADTDDIGEVFNLSVRAYRILSNVGIKTVAELQSKSESELLKYRDLGKVTLIEIRSHLTAVGRHLRP